MIAPGSKLALVAEALAAGDDVKAVGLARGLSRKKFVEADAIDRALEARHKPQFYREIGKDPDALWRLGVEAVKQLIGRLA